MKKFQDLKKSIIKEATVLGGAIVISGGVAFGVASFADSTAQKKTAMESEITGITGQIQSITDQMQKSGASSAKFLEVFGARSEDQFEVNRKEARNLLAKLREKYRLASLNLTISPEKLNEDPAYQNVQSKVYNSDIKVDAGAMSDVHFFSFVDEMIKTMPGMLRIRSFTLERNRNVEKAVYNEISAGGKPELVKGSIQMDWEGFENKKPTFHTDKKDEKSGAAESDAAQLPNQGAAP